MLAAQDNELAIAALGGVAVLVIAAIVVGAGLERRRTRALTAIAEKLGMRFDAGGDFMAAHAFSSFPLFSEGRRRQAGNVMSANASTGDGRLLLFDYRYTTGSGKNRRTHRQTVASVELPDRRLPRFRLAPENVFHRIAGAFGYQDIDLESSDAFSRKWLLRGRHEDAIRSLFDPLRVEALERVPPVCIEAEGEWLVVYRAGRRVKPDRIEGFLGEVREIARVFARA